MKTTGTNSKLPPALDATLKAIREARPCEQASYVHLPSDTKQAVDMLIAIGLVTIENAIPRPVK